VENNIKKRMETIVEEWETSETMVFSWTEGTYFGQTFAVGFKK
jgi:hypothetical protein